MRRVMVRYKVKPDRVSDNEALVRAVYDELAEARPDGFRYATFKLDDGVSFVHIAEITGDGNPLSAIEAFGRFQADIGARCDEPPAPTVLTRVGSYGVFEDPPA